MNPVTRIARWAADRLFALSTSGGGGGRVCEPLERRTLLTAPGISNFNFNYETTHSLTLDLNLNMLPTRPQVTDGLTNADLILRVATDTNISQEHIELVYNGSNPATFSFTNLPVPPNLTATILGDGNYRASISKQDLVHAADQMQSDAVHDFWVLAGDIIRDRAVNLADFNRLGRRDIIRAGCG